MAFRGALIGCGYVSRQQLSAWQQVEGADIVAVCDLDATKALQRAREFGIPASYADVEHMLAEVNPDFVDIATRPMNHLALVTETASRGIHVLCQKPMAASMAEAEQMVQVCDQANVVLMINENARHQAWFRKMSGLLDEGVLGTVHYARFENRWRSTLPVPDFDGQDYFQQMSQLLVFELGVHYLDAARYLFGEAQSLFATIRRISPEIAGEDLAVVVVQFRDLICTLDLNWFSVQQPEMEIISPVRVRIEGTEGTIQLDLDGKMTLYTDLGQQAWEFPTDTIPRSYIAAQQHFVDCLRTGKSPETSGVDTLKTMALVFAAYQSAEEERLIALG